MALLEQERAEAERRQLAVLDKAIEFDLLGLDVDAAIDKLKLARGICTGRDADGIAALYDEHAARRYEEGRDKGSNIALLFAMAVWRLALEEWTRERVPLRWAITQNNLGVALEAIGDRRARGRDCASGGSGIDLSPRAGGTHGRRTSLLLADCNR